MSKLLIVESPTKAKTISRMLGKQFDIIASMGHIRDLPEHDLGVDVGHDFAPQYVETPRSRQVVKNLKAAAKKAESIYLAPDPDREGEAIAWHLQSVLAPVCDAPFYRVTFHEITRHAIENALGNTGEINLNLVDAQQARRVLDRIVGYKVSPLLWRKLEKGRSAGRVQSAALRLVVEREREIGAFVPEEYWAFSAVFMRSGKEKIAARLFKIDGKDFKIPDEKRALELKHAVENASSHRVDALLSQEKRRHAPPPFTTSTLQQSANTSLHFSASSTMRYAQQLYEGVDLGNGGAVGLITYMRTDSVTLSRESQVAAAKFIEENYGKNYLPAKFNYYKNKAAAQEAHEAIRPTDVRRTPEAVAPYLDPQQLKLYTLIWKRFVASQMDCAIQNQYTLDVETQGADQRSYRFRAVATVTTFPGYTVLFNDTAKEENDAKQAALINAFVQGEALRLEKLDPAQKFTEPPPRYSEAALIKALEENGIGRPSTYATILRTIQDREYVKREQGKLVPSELGFSVNDFLVARLPELFDIGFTANMEKQLDEIEEGKRGWVEMMHEFYERLMPWIKAAGEYDAPPAETSQPLIEILKKVTFSAPEKSGSRIFDDKKFFASVEEKFVKSGKISARQQQALIALIARYRDQISDDEIGRLPENVREALQQAQQARAAREVAGKKLPELDYKKLFGAFDKVEFAAPEMRGRISYDDKKFFLSLKKQALSGRALSEKQRQALGRLAQKYQSSLAGADEVFSALGLTPAPDKEEKAGAGTAVDPAKLAALFAALDKVEFAAPVRRGRFVFDDKKFFESLKKQFSSGKALSEKQIVALNKMAAKYEVTDEQ
ncbi:MAG: type I DNA topoisomerase [Victivallaceae bacterium]|nr:type I DNA topoisomerase [Victivallaceae bacterium]